MPIETCTGSEQAIPTHARVTMLDPSRREARRPASCGGPSDASDGALGRIRTCDLLLRRQTRYPLRYEGVCRRRLRASPSACARYHTRRDVFHKPLPRPGDVTVCLSVTVAGRLAKEGLMEGGRALVVVNPQARHGETRDLLPTVTRLLDAVLPYDLAVTEEADDAARMAE